MPIKTFVVGPLQVNCFLVWDEPSRDAMIVDPGEESDRLLDAIDKLNLNLKMIINTHGHFDHIGGNAGIKKKHDVPLMIHGDDLPLLQRAQDHASVYGLNTTSSPLPDKILQGGETIDCGAMKVKVLHTPGHSPGGICLLVGDDLISGDLLFAGSIGRTDLPGGDMDILLESVRTQLFPLPEATRVHPGHGPSSTIGEEKATNPFLRHLRR